MDTLMRLSLLLFVRNVVCTPLLQTIISIAFLVLTGGSRFIEAWLTFGLEDFL